MTQTTIKLPEPPEYPASNASYSKTADKMHKAALNATTAAAGIAAVQAIIDHVKGINTYSKKTRRYGNELIAALGGEAPAETPAAKADKPAMPQMMKAEKPAAPKAKAAPKAAEPEAPAPADFGRAFSNKSNAKRALKAASLDHLPVQWEQAGEQVRPVVLVDDAKGRVYASERGFASKVSK